jgi:hypothetical protein
MSSHNTNQGSWSSRQVQQRQSAAQAQPSRESIEKTHFQSIGRSSGIVAGPIVNYRVAPVLN